MYSKTNNSDFKIKKIYKEKLFIFSMLMLFFITCAYIKGFWEIILILIIIFFGVIFEFFKKMRN